MESTLICTPKTGGCGYVGSGLEWRNADEDGHIILCPKCNEDHAFRLTADNFGDLTEGLSEENKQRAKSMFAAEHTSISEELRN